MGNCAREVKIIWVRDLCCLRHLIRLSITMPELVIQHIQEDLGRALERSPASSTFIRLQEGSEALVNAFTDQHACKLFNDCCFIHQGSRLANEYLKERLKVLETPEL